MLRFLLLIALFAVRPATAQLTEVTYRVRFDASWSADTHPDQFPTNAHFSGLVGAAHAGGTIIWQPGDTASPGIEQMAETGGKTLLRQEIDNLILLGQASSHIDGGGISSSPGSVVTAFVAHASHPFVTLVSMIAPSPDWFVGVNGLSLMQNGQWVDSLTVHLTAWDAGTDSGGSYTSANSDTQPRSPVAALTTPPFLVGGQVPSLGSFTFLCQSGCSTATSTESLPSAPLLSISPPWPNPTSGPFSVEIHASDGGVLEVMDVLGRVVLRQPIKAASEPQRIGLEGSHLTNGSYSIRYRSRSGMAVRTVIVLP